MGANQPTAYLLQDPRLAIGFMRALSQRGIRIPDQIALVTASCGELGKFLPVSLTTVHPDLKEKADKIVKLLLQRLRGELPPGTTLHSGGACVDRGRNHGGQREGSVKALTT